MRISVFGGSQPKESDLAYAEAMELGRLLAQHGHTVLTGGYIGVMEAVSRGAQEAGGHVIGVTCEEIEAWRPIKANAWVMEEIPRKRLWSGCMLSSTNRMPRWPSPAGLAP